MAETKSAITLNGKPLTFRITAIFQYRENYAADCWDGKGECPQGWKNKGSHEVLLADGVTLEMMDDKTFVNALVDKAMVHEDVNDYVEYWFNHLEQEVTGSWTRDEIMDAWELGIDNLEY